MSATSARMAIKIAFIPKFYHGTRYPLESNMVYFFVYVFPMPRKTASPQPVEIDRSRMPLVLAVVAFVGIGVSAGAIMWGRSDSGVIDVSATIANSQYATDRGEGGVPVAAPAQEYVDMPNGGLVAQDPGSVPPPPEPAPTEETASTTEGATTESTDTEARDGEATTETEAEPETEGEEAPPQDEGETSI